MLNHLYIKDFAIIPSLELEFQAGFTVITGETGAGKSILVDALGLLLGQRSDSTWVRQGANKAELTAGFSLDDNPAAAQWLAGAGLDTDEQCLLRRIITDSGRSRAWINGSPVTVQQLVDLGHLLVEIHGQNEHIKLTSPSRQFQLLDRSGDFDTQLTQVRDSFVHWKELKSEFQEMEQQSGISPAELEYLKFQFQELKNLAIAGPEVLKLEQEHRKLAKGGALMEALDYSATALDADESGIHTLLQRVIGRLQPYLELDPSISEVHKMLSEAAVNCQEAALSVRHASENVDLSPERLNQVTSQLSALADLARKHQVPMEDLGGVKDSFSVRLLNSENFASIRDGLQAQCDEALATYRECASSLSAARKNQAGILSAAVTELMSGLGMPGGVLEVHAHHNPQAPPSPLGDNRVEVLVSANPGVDPGPLARIASGGELSRISLAIKVASSGSRSSRTQIFDEVDAGIGGDTANAVGVLMQKLAQGTQALCVTHLAQVAVCADHQIQVRKEAMKDRIAVDTTILIEDERIDEIARMLGGRISDQSRRHASEMLSAARLH
ncbi:MAG: DNA repair protein RecN (Recombination protein N) [Lysobacterales bacterium]|jgi:DNA repair protein RecN (Recombination protein N)